MPQNVTLTQQQQRAIGALLTSPTLTAAAKSTGVARKTLYRWMEDPAFRAALDAAESEVLDGVSRRLLALAEKAADKLDALLDSANDNVRLRAASVTLDILMRLRELRDVERRLTELERMMHGQANDNAETD